jgi:hypothetical protein
MEKLRAMLNERRVELRMSMANVDEDAGLPPGTFAKIAAGVKNFGPGTLGPILDALDVEIALKPTGAGTEGKIDDPQEPLSNLETLRANAPLGGRINLEKPRAAIRARWPKWWCNFQ